MTRLVDWRAAAIAAICLLMAACTGVTSAYRAAQGLDEHAYVVVEHYAITLEQVAAYVERPNAIPSVKARLQDIERRTTPVILALIDARQAWHAAETVATEQALAEALHAAVVALGELINAAKAVVQ